MPDSQPDNHKQLDTLKRRLERERKARAEAEAVAEKGLRELYEKTRQLELLEKLAATANEATSVIAAVRFAISAVCGYTGWSIGNALLAEETPDGLRLVPTGVWHVTKSEYVDAFCSVSDEMQFAAGEGLPGRVLSTKVPVWISDLMQDGNFRRAPLAQSVGMKSAFAFPVLARDEVAAVLEFFSDRAQDVDDVLLRLMAQIGNLLGRVVDRKRSEAQLVHNASHDTLTKLPNRRFFLERLDGALEHRRRQSCHIAVLFIDLDRFKFVNDSLGHHVGDELIIQFADRVLSALLTGSKTAAVPARRCASKTTMARFGGDEFVLLLEDIADTDEAVAVAQLIKTVLETPFTIEGQEVYASASIGIVADPEADATPVEILRNADLALYRAKALGKSQHALFDPTMHVVALQRLTLENDLRVALRKQEFILHYQPIVSLEDSQIMGFEALVRWHKNGTELIQPGAFIQVAEEIGLIVPMGMWILEEACNALQRLRELCAPDLQPYVSVNLSVRQFSQHDLIQKVAEIIARTGIDPHCLRLEITESVAMLEGERTHNVLSGLRAIGVRLAIDDFGTGYSSLSQLHDYPLEVLKIDRSFVARMRTGREGKQIIQTIINLANSLGMKVIAEGVETPAELALLQSMGCKLGQGYLFSRPVAERDLRDLLIADNSQPRAAARRTA